jgi:hypothetical protein
MFKRKRKNLLRGFSFGFFDLAAFALCTVDPNAPTIPAGDGDDTLTGGGGGIPPRTYSAGEVAAITKERTKYRKQMKSLAKSLGIDPESLEFVETNDPENPYEVQGEAFEELREAAEKMRSAPGDTGAKKRDLEEKKRRIQLPIIRERDAARAERDALKKWVQSNAVGAPIRLACRESNAIDDDGGKFQDIVNLLSPRMPVNVSWDEDDRTATVSIPVLDENGDPLANATGDPMRDAKILVDDLLKRKPKYKQANFRPGPGAGGANGHGEGAISGEARTKRIADAVNAFTGAKPTQR